MGIISVRLSECGSSSCNVNEYNSNTMKVSDMRVHPEGWGKVGE